MRDWRKELIENNISERIIKHNAMLNMPSLTDLQKEKAYVLGLENRNIPSEKYPSRFRQRMILNSPFSEQMILIICDPLGAGERLTSISRALGYHSLLFSTEEALMLLRSIMIKLFRDSDPIHSPKRGKPLGDLAISVVMYLTGHVDPKAFQLLENPLFNSQGNIEQKYLDMSKLLKSYNPLIDSSEWSLLLRSKEVPLSDAIFVERHKKGLTRSVITLGLELSK